MAGDSEAFGQLVDAGLVGAALQQGGAAGPGGDMTACGNCGAGLAGRYCHNCGQRGEVHRSLSHLLEEYYHGQIRLDGKLWRTLPLLLLRPGTLTRRYVRGQRVRFVSPIGMFLFTVFLMFFTVATINPVKHLGEKIALSEQDRAVLDKDLVEARSQLSQAERDIEGQAAPEKTDEKVKAAVAAMDKAQQANDKAAADDYIDFTGGKWRDAIKKMADDDSIHLGINEKVNERARQSLRDPDLLLYKIRNVASGYSFLLVPMSVPFLWLIFLRRRGVYVFDHVIFVLHSLSFMALFVVICALAWRLDLGKDLRGWPLLVPPLHIFSHVMGAYQLGFFAALWRTIYLLWVAVLVLSLYLAVILLLGLLF